MVSGGFNSTLDEKGRFTFPARLRDGFAGDALFITRGIDRCLWAFPPEYWQQFADRLKGASAMRKDVRLLQRHFLGWAVQLEFDRGGRLAIPQALREWAALKRDCVVMGLGERIEIWDGDMYRDYSGEAGDGEKQLAAAEELSDLF